MRTLFDAARERRDEGMARADAHAAPEWKDRAWDALVAYLEGHESWFCDDFWAWCENTGALERPANGRALGPLVRKAAAAGLMHKSSETRPSVASNLSPKVVWRSDLYGRAVW